MITGLLNEVKDNLSNLEVLFPFVKAVIIIIIIIGSSDVKRQLTPLRGLNVPGHADCTLQLESSSHDSNSRHIASVNKLSDLTNSG